MRVEASVGELNRVLEFETHWAHLFLIELLLLRMPNRPSIAVGSEYGPEIRIQSVVPREGGWLRALRQCLSISTDVYTTNGDQSEVTEDR